jgi:hypothetical protein
VDARRIAGLRHVHVLVAEAAAGIDDDVARGNAGRFGQQVDHRFGGLRILGRAAPVAEIEVGAVGRGAVPRAHELVAEVGPIAAARREQPTEQGERAHRRRRGVGSLAHVVATP